MQKDIYGLSRQEIEKKRRTGEGEQSPKEQPPEEINEGLYQCRKHKKARNKILRAFCVCAMIKKKEQKLQK